MTHLAFDAHRDGFSLVNALACARVSLLAYDDAAAVERTAGEWGFDRARVFAREANAGIVLSGGDLIVVAFRGTDERADWLTNLNILLKRSPLGLVHRGFMEAAESFWPELARYLLEGEDNGRRVWVTGHSLGGAVALLAATKLLVEDHVPIAGLYTFGQPPVGATSFCSAFEEQRPFPMFRFINHTDAVADAPLLSCEHVGDVRYFDTSGALWEGEPPWRVRLGDAVRAPRKYGGLSQISAHAMKTYVELLASRVSA